MSEASERRDEGEEERGASSPRVSRQFDNIFVKPHFLPVQVWQQGSRRRGGESICGGVSVGGEGQTGDAAAPRHPLLVVKLI